jgi:hypothetical protein
MVAGAASGRLSECRWQKIAASAQYGDAVAVIADRRPRHGPFPRFWPRIYHSRKAAEEATKRMNGFDARRCGVKQKGGAFDREPPPS